MEQGLRADDAAAAAVLVRMGLVALTPLRDRRVREYSAAAAAAAGDLGSAAFVARAAAPLARPPRARALAARETSR